MFFGWNKVGKKTHLLSTWLVAIGSNISSWWILVANAWMNNPVGMHFNPATARCEMLNFTEVAFSPFAVHKFLHTVTSSYTVAALFVIGVSAWYLIKKRSENFAKKSIVVASIYGLIMSLLVVISGDNSTVEIAKKQPIKLAAFEGLYKGTTKAPLMAFGIINNKVPISDTSTHFKFKIEFPSMLSQLAFKDKNAFVPGIYDLVYGNYVYNIEPVTKKMERGTLAMIALNKYKFALQKKDTVFINQALSEFNKNSKDLGYAYINNPIDVVPNIPLSFYSFHLMVGLGMYFIILFLVMLIFAWRKWLLKFKLFLWLVVITIPLGYLASELGWVVAELGRQPWAIQDLLPVSKATTHINSNNVKITFVLFAILFTILLITELSIMLKQIKTGPKDL